MWSDKKYEHTIGISMDDLQSIIETMSAKDKEALIVETIRQDYKLYEIVKNWILDENK